MFVRGVGINEGMDGGKEEEVEVVDEEETLYIQLGIRREEKRRR